MSFLIYPLSIIASLLAFMADLLAIKVVSAASSAAFLACFVNYKMTGLILGDSYGPTLAQFIP